MSEDVGYSRPMDFKTQITQDTKTPERLLSLRREVNEIHQQIFELLLKRIELTEKIWHIKIDEEIPFHDSTRENELYEIPLHMNMRGHPEAIELYKQVTQLILKENKRILASRVLGSPPVLRNEADEKS